jgi:hypothetical protein
MRMTNTFLLGGVLLLAFALFSFVYAAIDPDGGDSVRGLVFFTTPLFPAMMGLVLIVAGYAVGLLNRATWDMPQPA